VLVVVSMFAGAVAAAAFNDDHGKPLGVTVEWLPQDITRPAPATATPDSGAPGSSVVRPTVQPTPGPVTGFEYPIAGGCLPVEDSLMPGAPREYRNGIHEGVDFYDIDNCASIGLDTAVLAAKAGRVIRADMDYIDITPEQVAELEQEALDNGSSEEIEDIFRGRQVWVDHGNGIVTRYAHLNGIADGIQEGSAVSQGELIAFVGDSGTPESVTDPGSEVHLHFEIRVGDSYLGADLDPQEVRQLFEDAFAP
jgi:murein DD-endopeptidase MepM/ murein hydrolase activator NlpD